MEKSNQVGTNAVSGHPRSDWIEPGAFSRLKTLHAFLLGQRDRDVDASLVSIFTQRAVSEFTAATVPQAGLSVANIVGWMCAVPEFNELGLKGVAVGLGGGSRVFAIEHTDSAGEKLRSWEAVRAFFGLEFDEAHMLFTGDAEELRRSPLPLDEKTHYHDINFANVRVALTDRRLGLMRIRNWLFWSGAISIDDFCAMAEREEAPAPAPVELLIDVAADGSELPVPIYAIVKVDDALYSAVRQMARICRQSHLAAGVRDINVEWGPDSVSKDPSRIDLPQMLVDQDGGFYFMGVSHHGDHRIRTESLDLHHVQMMITGAQPGERRFSTPDVEERFREAHVDADGEVDDVDGDAQPATSQEG